MRSLVVVGALGLAATSAGCGASGAPSAALDCNYLASDNCWKTTATMGSSCLPPMSATGVLSADGGTCTYATGEVVTFTPPLVLPLPDTPRWNFTVKSSSGAPCLSYADDGNGGITLTVQGQTVRETPQGTLGLKLTCPDGTSYATSNAFTLFDCPDAGLLDDVPGAFWSDSDTSVSLSLLGSGGSSSDGAVFSCGRATP
jgi:hypothetical protein